MHLRLHLLPARADDARPPAAGCLGDSAVLTAELAGRLAGTVRVAKLNVDENPGKAGGLGVRSIPTLLLFNHGKVIGQMVGAAAAPLR